MTEKGGVGEEKSQHKKKTKMHVRTKLFQIRRFRQAYDLVAVAGGEGEMGPKEIAETLDKYVIGQAEAKKEVAVAIRERWRRLQLGEEKAVEITPKNMLVTGPSGCGKTEIIRRVSKLLHAPFVKVDASTFTRRGVVGANVSDMIVDLYDAAEDQCKDFYAKSVKKIARKAALDLVHHLLLKNLKSDIASSSKIHHPKPIIHEVRPPPRMSDSPMNLNLSGLEKALGEALKKTGLATDGQPIVVYNKHDGRSSTTREEEEEEEDVDKGNKLDQLLKMSFEEMEAMDDAVLSDMLWKLMAELESISGPEAPRFTFPELKGGITVESIDSTDEHVIIALTKQQDRSFPQILLSSGMGFFGEGGPGGDASGMTHDSGSMKDLLLWWEEKILEALSAFRFAPGRSPVKGLVEKWGIVCIDEIDKVVGKKSSSGQDRWMNTDVQQELLTLIEGTKVNLESARSLKSGGGLSVLKMGGQQERVVIDTTHILFVCAGAFTLCKPKDMLVELLGRLPVRVAIHSLSEPDLYRILTQTKYPLIQQQTDLFSTENVTLLWEDAAIRKIAQIAWHLNNETENTGARVLNTILRAVLSEYSYLASDMSGQTVTITEGYVVERTKRLFPSERLETYVL
eukprot:TRINITY_DN1301_c0_g1_i1.p1 TRINITY_DN1301_c0_g1~~TRINITY_DN1301_c0_g1_i1.p1  ORF type:complete len:625 (+),score=125.70 TRINITY_DN1301_c0_g1_i1:315-2189(+)